MQIYGGAVCTHTGMNKANAYKKLVYRKLRMYRMSSTTSGVQMVQLRQEFSNQPAFTKREHPTGKSLKFV